MIGNAFIHTIKVFLSLDPPHTQTTLKERELLAKYARNAEAAVEIGVYEGVNTVSISKVMNDKGTLYAIDPFFRGRLGISYSKWIATFNLKKENVYSKVKIIPKYSWEAVDEVPDKLDFIFIDGDHSLEGIIRDWEDWSDKVKNGGFMALHDTSIPIHDCSVEQLGSYKYFQSHIKNDTRFIVCDQIDSLNILQRI